MTQVASTGLLHQPPLMPPRPSSPSRAISSIEQPAFATLAQHASLLLHSSCRSQLVWRAPYPEVTASGPLKYIHHDRGCCTRIKFFCNNTGSKADGGDNYHVLFHPINKHNSSHPQQKPRLTDIKSKYNTTNISIWKKQHSNLICHACLTPVLAVPSASFHAPCPHVAAGKITLRHEQWC